MLGNVKTKLFEKAGMQTKTRAVRIPLVPLTLNIFVITFSCNIHWLEPLAYEFELSHIYIYIYIYIYIMPNMSYCSTLFS